MTKIGIITGSNRDEAQSERIGHYAREQVSALYPNLSTDFFSLRELNVPLWQEEKWDKDSEMSEQWAPISKRLADCDGFVVVCPEWAGMAPAHLKNFLLMCDAGEVAHKPGMLIGVSSGMGGAYPIAELHMSGTKNNFLMWLPDHMIFRNVKDLFTSPEPTELDESLTQRLHYSLTFLVEMAEAMGPVREKCQDLKSYKNGM
ncbi:NADPH-dependent FMN reductase [Sneathiella limimaris]|uniref:NADPH-dependent FMN reductase n=1 Tax=Sneathiella limimaris TaxID=1964213 RepID=UPI00146B59FA|nr:NAD(P)H-dependent oxidoreductase [Sneathiella limimaris]